MQTQIVEDHNRKTTLVITEWKEVIHLKRIIHLKIHHKLDTENNPLQNSEILHLKNTDTMKLKTTHMIFHRRHGFKSSNLARNKRNIIITIMMMICYWEVEAISMTLDSRRNRNLTLVVGINSDDFELYKCLIFKN